MKLLVTAIGVLLLVVAACSHKVQMAGRPHPRVPWKLVFKDPTLVTDVDRFERILDRTPGRWEKGMTVKKRVGEQPRPRPDHTSGDPGLNLPEDIYPDDSQAENGDQLHVTQKVVLRNQAALDELVSLIEHPHPSSK